MRCYHLVLKQQPTAGAIQYMMRVGLTYVAVFSYGVAPRLCDKIPCYECVMKIRVQCKYEGLKNSLLRPFSCAKYNVWNMTIKTSICSDNFVAYSC
jgi:hypothetical protein